MADLRFNVSAETRQATAALGSFAQSVQRNLVQAVRSLPAIEINADSSDAEREMARIRSEMANLANQRVGIDISADQASAEVDRLQGELRQLGSTTTDVGIRANASQADRALDRISSEVRGLPDGEVEVTADTSQAESEIESFSGRMSGLGHTAGTALGTAIGSAAADLVSQGIETAIETSTSNAALEARLMGDPVAMERAGAVAGQLWAGGYGESMTEVNDAVFAAISSSAEMRDASTADLREVTESAMNLSTVWGVDVAESMRAAGQLVRNDLVPTTQEGLGLIHQAFADLGPAGDDAIDTVVEYSTQFRQLGLDGPAAMEMMSQAINAGARDTDTAADALKEFALIAVEGGDDVNAAFQEIGLNGEEMGRKIAAGGPGAREALDQTMEGLRGIEDPAKRAELAVELFGTKAEDLQEALFAMDPSPTTQKFGDLEKSMDDVNNQMSGTFQNGLNQTNRGLIGLGTSMGETDQVVRSGLGIWSGLMDIFGVETGQASETAGEALRGVGDELGVLTQRFDEVPAGKSVTVDALTEDAAAQLTELGFEVRELPDGRFEVIPETEQAVSALDALVADASGKSAVITLDADPDPATGKINGTLDLGNGATTTLTLDANPDPATGKINGTVDLGNGETATITIDGNQEPANGKINATVTRGDGSTSTITLDANNVPALGKTNDAVRTGNQARASMTLDANTSPAQGAIGRAVSWAWRQAQTVMSWFSGGGVVGYSGGGLAGAPRYAGGGMSPQRSNNGAVVRGYSPGQDTVPALLSPGEAVLVPELVRQIGARNILAANNAASGGRSATVIGSVAGIMTGELDPVRAAGGMVSAPSVTGAISGARLAAATDHARGITSSQGDAIVSALLGTRAELRALRGDMVQGNYGAAQLAALQSLAGALRHTTSNASALSAAREGLTTSVTGAW